MNMYDREEIIINRFQAINITRMCMLPVNLNNFRLYSSVHNPKKWKKWFDTSAKNELPPDFYNDRLKLMMDVMRIDDHTYVNEKGRVINRHSEIESKLVEQLISKNESIRKIAESGNLFITPYTGMFGHEDHNYDLYVKNFKRVVEKHIKKIEKYKINHPGFKIIFFIFDESTPYIKLIDCEAPKVPGDLMSGELHYWWKDKNMLDIIKDSGIDYLIWFTPFKHFRSVQKVRYPLAVIYEVSKINFDKMIKYRMDELESAEL